MRHEEHGVVGNGAPGPPEWGETDETHKCMQTRQQLACARSTVERSSSFRGVQRIERKLGMVHVTAMHGNTTFILLVLLVSCCSLACLVKFPRTIPATPSFLSWIIRIRFSDHLLLCPQLCPFCHFPPQCPQPHLLQPPPGMHPQRLFRHHHHHHYPSRHRMF